jgi:hypothetical protein
MAKKKCIVIEVMYKADYCLPCLYMDETVRAVIPPYGQRIDYRRVDFMKGEGKKRFLELSRRLFGRDAVEKRCKLAPVPSLFIDGELVCDAIPPVFELVAAIDEALAAKGIGVGKGEKNERQNPAHRSAP